MPAVLEWMYADYRATSRSKTFLEKRLKQRSTTRVERALIEARMKARLSIYRVVSTQPGESLELEDIFDGEKFTVHDRAMSGCGLDGTFLPLRIQKLGKWNSPVNGGPPLPHMAIAQALAILEQSGVELSAAGLRRASEVVGRLWELALPRNRGQIRLTNTDGDELELITATFTVADGAGLTRALGERDDVRFEEPNGVWVWSRRGAVGGMADNTLLARLEMMDDRLVVEVNSAERLATAREWLEKVPGVRFERSRAREMTTEGGPLDDKLPGVAERLSPEGQRQMAEWNRKQAFAWLDREVPMLGGLTPRQACGREGGRRQVEILIRTMPGVAIPGGTWAPPREELLKELGLGRGKTASAGEG
jgi:hypothetical protein